MTRPEHLASSGLSAKDVRILLDAVVSCAQTVRLAYLWRPRLHDPDDDMVLEAAINGRADRLVTFNVRDFASAAAFRLLVCRPGEALRALEMDR